MGTGIVSIALFLDDQRAMARAWMVAASVVWVSLWLAIGVRLAGDRAAVQAQARQPAGLAVVAATAVLGSEAELSGLDVEAILLLGVAAAAWVLLSIPLLRARRLPRTGSSFMTTVATQSLAVLAALLAARGHGTWLCYPALVLCALGLALYPVALVRFDFRELADGAGDHWIAGGALAISALAVSEISIAARRTGAFHAIASILADFGSVIWIAGLGWLALLIASELGSPRLDYNARRWSTMFPVGMYAASGFVVAHASALSFPDSFATVWTWVSVALWLTLAGAAVRRLTRLDSRARVR